MSETKNNANMQLTTEQELSLRTDRHISVTANAGSGKTFVLVKRFQEIINNGIFDNQDIRIDVSKIIAITFTRKAAAEMHKKIIQAFDNELLLLKESRKPNKKSLERLKRIREGLSYANISTIHSFCSNLLRQFPIESGVPVNFSELNEAENIRLKNKSVENVLNDWLLISGDKKGEWADILLGEFTRNQLTEYVTTILNKVELFEKFQSFFMLNDDEILKKLRLQVWDTFDINFLKKEVFEITKMLSSEELLDATKSNTTKDAFDSRAANFGPLILSISEQTEDLEEITFLLENFINLTDGTYTKENKLNRYISNWIVNDSYQEYLISSDSIIELCRKLHENLKSFSTTPEFLTFSRILWEFVIDVRDTIDDEKTYLNALDFDDLQLKVLKLLDNPNVLEKVTSQIDFIMIDEFQDTNEIQYNIVRKLIPEIYDKSDKHGINLFIVGDAKQSIYGFRNADVRVFNKIVDDIFQKNSILYQNNELSDSVINPPERDIESEEQKGKNKLTSTFRLRPEIASFVNYVCDNIMTSGSSEFEVDYTPLVCSKETEKIEILDKRIVKNGYMGKVVFLLSKSENNENKEEVQYDDSDHKLETNSFRTLDAEDTADMPEEVLIADFIKSLVGSKLEGKKEPLQYKDMAILARRRKKFSDLGSVLLHNKIPFILHSGKDFFNTEEILDFISFLKFIYNPEDNSSLISILRSPFFNIDDTKILFLSQSSIELSIWRNLKNKRNVSPEFENTCKILEDIVEISSTMSISKVILFIMEKTGWSGLIATKPGRHQIISNIDKFIEIARSFENRGFKNIYDFVEELKFIQEHKVGESEAAVLSNDNSVNIMTVHASKGLQFPVVILYDTNSGVQSGSKLNISSDFAFGFKSKQNHAGVFENRVDNIINIINKEISKKSEEAEAKRVLYVAMTRAEEILAVSSCAKTLKNGIGEPLGQFKLILDGLGLSIDYLYDNDSISVETELEIRKNKKFIKGKYDFTLEKFVKPTKASEEPDTSSDNIQLPLILLNNVKSGQNEEYFSPTKLSSFHQNEEEYFNKYILGIENQSDFEINSNDRYENSGTDIGLAIHKVMENLKEWIKDDLTINQNLLEQIIAEACNTSVFNPKNTIHNRIISECINIAKTKLIKKELDFLKLGKSEYKLSIPIGDNIVTGIIDLMFKSSEDLIEIWDWKSNIIDSDDKKKELIKHYELQMKIYSYFIACLYPTQSKFKARLHFTNLATEVADDDEWTHCFTWSKDELMSMREIIENNIAEIRNKLYFWLD